MNQIKGLVIAIINNRIEGEVILVKRLQKELKKLTGDKYKEISLMFGNPDDPKQKKKVLNNILLAIRDNDILNWLDFYNFDF